MTEAPANSAPSQRPLGLFSVFSIAAGAMISSGLFVLPGIAFAQAGPAVILAYGLAAILVVPVMMAKAELATAMPKAGGSYFYIERSLGPLAGTFAGLANWLSIALKSAFALVGIGVMTLALYPQMGVAGAKAVAIVACLIFVTLNLLSTEHTGRLQVALVVALIGCLLLYLVYGIPKVQVESFSPFAPYGFNSVLAVAGVIFVSYGGLTKVVSVSEEIRNPARNLPLGMFTAFAVVSGLYVLVVYVTVGIVPAKELAGNLMPIAEGARAVMGPIGIVIIDLAALLAFATTANSGILSASRSPMAMSRDGLLPAFFARTGENRGTPHVGITVTAAFIIATIVLLRVEDLVKTASTMMIVMFSLVNISILIMRKSGLQNYRPTYRAPLCPWLQMVTLVIYVLLILEMGFVPLMLTGLFCLATLTWYVFYIHRRIDRASALVYLVKRVADKKLARPELEDELKQITIERDEIALDRFDLLVKRAEILDLPDSIPAADFFRTVADRLAGALKQNPKEIYQQFLERERQSSTVLEPGLAIPHIIVEGEHIFCLMLVRCKEGIVFSELEEPVRSVFVLAGSKDERNYHLRALMNIARVVQEPDFRTRWMNAQDPEGLRDVILLSARPRND